MRALLWVACVCTLAWAASVKEPYSRYEDGKKPDYDDHKSSEYERPASEHEHADRPDLHQHADRPDYHRGDYKPSTEQGRRPMLPPPGIFPPPFPGHLPPPPPHMHYGPPLPPPEFIVKEIISAYCQNPVLQKCLEESLKIPEKMRSLDYPETISLNQLFIRSMGARKVLDIGCFTGANSLAAALVLPKDGEVVALDDSENFTNKAVAYWKEANVLDQIKLIVQDPLASLKDILEVGGGGKFDFVFIDHDLVNYDQYYELSLKLLRRGGMIAFDNRLRQPTRDKKAAEVLKELNQKLDQDKRVTVYNFNIGDGLTLVFVN